MKKDEGGTERVPETAESALPDKIMLPRFFNLIHFYKKTSAAEAMPAPLRKIFPVPSPHAAETTAECYVRESDFLPEDIFLEVLSFERKRAERTHKPVFLMLLDLTGIEAVSNRCAVMRHVAQNLVNLIPAVSTMGWHRDREILGIILAEPPDSGGSGLQEKIDSSFPPALRGLAARLAYRFISFPQTSEQVQQAGGALFYPDLPESKRRTFALFMKRAMDVVGGVGGILLFLPLFIVLPFFIKMSSKGPVLFKQERIGQHGEKFTFLKFRTMTVDNDPRIHQEYIKKLIREQKSYEKDPEKRQGVYKISDDPRVTKVGKFLRKTSLDELPQFFNVLRGEMSLVGPRPPIPYEVENYEPWHFRRVMEIKPGITGLWQVSGRSSTSFDEMVRLDLKYAREWNLWMDIKILLRTPWVVIAGKGAY